MVIVLHGGPGTAGHMAPVARELAAEFRVLEPFQRGSGDRPLTVATHVADLAELIDSRCAGERPVLVGFSWGAMLALAFAAAHPDKAGPLVLIGCGTFDRHARRRMQEILDERMDPRFRERLREEIVDRDERLRVTGELLLRAYSRDLITADTETETWDARAHDETWTDMKRLQEEGVYPAAFAAIASPVLMLHGAADPHPGRMILASLSAWIPQIEYREWERCGHYPWLERAVRAEFFTVLREWLGVRRQDFCS